MTQKEHIRQLLAEYKIKPVRWLREPFKHEDFEYLGWCNLDKGYYCREIGVWMPRDSIVSLHPWSNLGYFTCLHEIGHFGSKHTYKYWLKYTLDAEVQAWDWALENAITAPVGSTVEIIKSGIDNYYDWASRNHSIRYQTRRTKLFERLNGYSAPQS